MIDTPRVRKQTRQFSSLRGEGGDLSDLDSDEEYPPSNSRHSRASRRSDRHSGGGYGRTDCFRVEKHLLVYGCEECISCIYYIFFFFLIGFCPLFSLFYLCSSFLVGVAGGTSYPMPGVSGVWASVMWRRSVALFWSSVCFTIVETRTSRVSSGSSSRRQRMGVNHKRYSTTRVWSCT